MASILVRLKKALSFKGIKVHVLRRHGFDIGILLNCFGIDGQMVSFFENLSAMVRVEGHLPSKMV